MTRILATILGAGLFLAGCQSTFAQHRVGQLQTLWDEVQNTYPGIEARDAKIEAAAMEEKTIFGERLPQLRTQAQNSYASYNGISGTFFPQPGLFNVSGANGLTGPSWTFNSYASATLEWELFAFGKHRYRSKAARSKTERATSEQETYQLQLQKELSQRYIELLHTATKLDMNQDNVDRLNSIRSITSGLARAGLKSAADSLLASSSYNQAWGEHEHLKGAKQAVLIQLLELTNGKKANYQQSVERFLNPSNHFLSKRTEISPGHPRLITIEEQRHILEYQEKSESSAALPSINLIGGYAYRGSGIGSDGVVSDNWNEGFSNSATNGLVGVGITWNLSDLYTKKQRAGSLKKQAQSEGYSHKQYRQQMQAALTSIQQQLDTQYVEVQKTDEAQQQANKAYHMYLSRYKSGLMDLGNLLQIQMLLDLAEKKHIAAVYGFWMLNASEAELLAVFSPLFNNL